jgi:hypothetical protein
MTLDNLPLVDKANLTKQFPVLLVGANSAGKSYALENMSEADKKRTIVLNFDTKPIGLESNEFAAVFAVSSSMDKIKEQMNALPAEAKEYKTHFANILATSYFIDDPEAIDKIVDHILKATFSPKIDRIVLDTFTSMIDFCEAWANTNFTGRDVWAKYGFGVQKIQQALKEATIFGFKFTYVFAHHDYIPPHLYATTPKQALAVKGGIMKNNVETAYNTIIFSYLADEGKRMFQCDSNNAMDTSRTKLLESAFKFERNSLDDIEQLLNRRKHIVDEQLVEV